MTTINFVPDDYIQQRKSSRANVLSLVLLAFLLGGIAVTFSVIKMRQAVVRSEMEQLNSRMVQAREQINRLEQVKSKGRVMMKNMKMTADLLEPVPRSVVLACLTNTMPSGVSLLEIQLQEKEVKVAFPAVSSVQSVKTDTKPTQYQAAAAKDKAPVEFRTVIQTLLEIEGIAHSDIEVASYIANLSESVLLDNVQLVQSKEQNIGGVPFRQFRLRTQLKQNLTLTKEDINSIRKKREQTG
ncbi:MAG: PilN domain-containing protein [Planctomycetes bacterium]|nr:PilN domain-containing protein [Planctomycetota bacterium]